MFRAGHATNCRDNVSMFSGDKVVGYCIITIYAVLRIRIRIDPELLPGSGSGIIVPDPDPAKNERADKLKFYHFRLVNSGLWVL